LTTGAPAVLIDAIRAGVLNDLINSPNETLRDIALRWRLRPATVKRYKRSLNDARRIAAQGAYLNPASALRLETAVTNPLRKPSAAVLDLTDAAPGE
jgi:hypothetical protein